MKAKKYAELLNKLAEKYPDLPVVYENERHGIPAFFELDYGPSNDSVIIYHDGYEKQEVICLN